MIWLLLTIVAVMVPYVGVLPLWLYPFAVLIIGWRLMVHTGRWRFPHWSVRLVLLAGCAVVVLATLNGGSSLQVMIVLLLLAFLLKLLEMYQRRDALVVLYVAYLLAVSAFLFNQSIPIALYVLFTLVVITATLHTVYQSNQPRQFWRSLRRVALLFVQAVPLMLVLFLIFPRLPPLWSVDLSQGQARSGLSDTLSPGDVSRLTRSAEVAFRVSFEAELPAEAQRYWRGIVYDRFDGRRWLPSLAGSTASIAQGQPRAGERQALDGMYAYQIVLEATGQRWRYALDVPVDYPVSLQRQADYTLVADQPLNQRTQYRIVSATGYRITELPAETRQRNLQLPVTGNPRTRQLAQRWRQQSASDAEYVEKILQLYQRSFIYTLQPPRLGEDSIDQFLFDSQRGFCGHYASSSVFLLRAAGIPARIIGGYQGGELNPVDGSLTVRQYEAHAWIEAWLPEQGWLRIDPTAAVAPERIEQPADAVFAGQPGFLADDLVMRSGLRQVSWLKQLRWQYDALNYGWNRWVLNFQNNQHQLLADWLGGVTVVKLIMLLLIPAGLVLLLVAWGLLRTRQPRSAPVERALARLNQRLVRLGYARASGETVTQHAQRVAVLLPEIAEPLLEVAHCYEMIRYADPVTRADRPWEKQLYRAIQRCYALLPIR